MNRTDVIALIAEEESMTKRKAEEVVRVIIDSMKEALVLGDKVQITGFGTFEVRDRAPRVGRNPKTNEEVKIEAFKKPIFRPSQTLKERVNK